MAMMMNKWVGRPTIVIIGGGFSGTLLAVQLLQSAALPITIQLIECRPVVGVGVAYGTDEDCYFLNVPASNMSAFPDDAGHFLRWLQRQDGPCYQADSFLPRKRYGVYLQAVLQEAIASVADYK